MRRSPAQTKQHNSTKELLSFFHRDSPDTLNYGLIVTKTFKKDYLKFSTIIGKTVTMSIQKEISNFFSPVAVSHLRGLAPAYQTFSFVRSILTGVDTTRVLKGSKFAGGGNTFLLWSTPSEGNQHQSMLFRFL